MIKYTHYFSVERNSESTELKVQVEIEDNTAQIDGTIFEIIDDDECVPWDGTLTHDEINMVEEEAYDKWSDQELDEINEDDYEQCLYELNSFDDDRAIHLANGGKVYY